MLALVAPLTISAMPTRAAREESAGTELSALRARVADLERERDLLNAIANCAPSLLCLVDPGGCVRPYATNRAFERALGYAPDETGGVRFWERYVVPEDAESVRDAILAVVAGGDVVERDGRWLTRAGEVIDVVWSCTPLPRFATGPAWLISATDITDRRRHEEEVRQSRARLVAAGTEARKRIEQNLHDGAQQRLASLLLRLRFVRSRGVSDPSLAEVLDGAIDELVDAIQELRDLAHGIHPEILTRRGLASALRVAAGRLPIPVELELTDERYHEHVEATAYYVGSEALANMAKHSGASRAVVRARSVDGRLILEVEDDGVGGADPAAGTGLSGLADRVAAADGAFRVESTPGAGTLIVAAIPLP
jgi:PAS domain S-box-containing protein